MAAHLSVPINAYEIAILGGSGNQAGYAGGGVFIYDTRTDSASKIDVDGAFPMFRLEMTYVMAQVSPNKVAAIVNGGMLGQPHFM